MKKIIAVMGATGIQGGSVVRILLESNIWHVRAVTRNPDGDKAKALAASGVEVVAGNLDDVGSLIKAYEVSCGFHFAVSCKARGMKLAC